MRGTGAAIEYSAKIPRNMPKFGKLRRYILQSADDQMNHAVLALE